mgnify:CR=1 FL=1
MATVSHQHVAMLMGVGRRNMDARDVATVDGETVATIIEVAGPARAAEAAEAVRALVEETTQA